MIDTAFAVLIRNLSVRSCSPDLERQDLVMHISRVPYTLQSTLTSFLPTATASSSLTLTPPTVSTNANGTSPMTFLNTSPTVEFLRIVLALDSLTHSNSHLYLFTNTQSLKTGALTPPDSEPEVKLVMLRTGKTGTRPRSSAARVRDWTTPVLPNRYSTIYELIYCIVDCNRTKVQETLRQMAAGILLRLGAKYTPRSLRFSMRL